MLYEKLHEVGSKMWWQKSGESCRGDTGGGFDLKKNPHCRKYVGNSQNQSI